MKVSGLRLNTATVHLAGGTRKDEDLKDLDRGLNSIPMASASSLREYLVNQPNLDINYLTNMGKIQTC